jgi:dihydrofolate reductase
MTQLTLIAALANNNVIGRNNTLPWHLPEDLKHFKEATLGAPVIMGRKTWESLPEKFRPLPGRLNIVVSRDLQRTRPLAAGATVVDSLPAALAACGETPEAFLIGGAELYRQAIEQADRLLITEIDLEVEGADAFFPPIDPASWKEKDRRTQTSASGLRFAFVIYERD